MPRETQPKDIVKILKINELKESPFQGRLFSIAEKEAAERDQKRLEELTGSIRQSGLMQPVIVRPVAGGYEIIDGHRRVAATRKLGQGPARFASYPQGRPGECRWEIG
jgi:ParB/RepB/Spo0J family partition protein